MIRGTYDAEYWESVNHPDEYWKVAAQEIEWFKPYNRVFKPTSKSLCHWFPGGELNTCYNVLDRHVRAGRGDQPALIYDSPVTNTFQTFTYKQLLDLVARFAGVLVSHGVKKGDRVVIYMPMIPQALVAMLACARIGAIHSVVFGGFAPNELAIRIDDARPKIVVSASCGIEGDRIIEYKPLLDRAISVAHHKPEHCIIVQRRQIQASQIKGRDLDWDEEMAVANSHACVPMASNAPLYILYTSGTTGIPKGVVRDNGGYAVALKWTMKKIYNMEPGEVFWAASDVGWVVGHSYIVYGPLLHGCTTVMYEGKPVGTPDPGAFWRVVSEYNVKTLFLAPTALRAIKKEDASGQFFKIYDLSSFQYLFVAGERLDPDTYFWATNHLNKPVIDHWWQTETGWAIAANCIGIEQLPIKPGSPTKAVPGYQIEILDSNGTPVACGIEGNIAIKLPLPPGTLTTLWQRNEHFLESYFSSFPGYYTTGDGGYIDEEGYLYVMGRVDDVINVAGHRLSTGAMEEVITRHPDVAECAVIGIRDGLKGQIPVGFVSLKGSVEKVDAQIEKELVGIVREQIGAIACLRKIFVVQTLPKTRSGKILRSVMRKIVDGEKYQAPSTIDDINSLRYIENAVESMKHGQFESEVKSK